MPKFKVIKAHDGIEEGFIKVLPISSLTEYMVANGYWEEVKEEEPTPTKTEKPKASKKTTRK